MQHTECPDKRQKNLSDEEHCMWSQDVPSELTWLLKICTYNFSHATSKLMQAALSLNASADVCICWDLVELLYERIRTVIHFPKL